MTYILHVLLPDWVYASETYRLATVAVAVVVGTHSVGLECWESLETACHFDQALY
jgi:hypothetical protein